MFNQPIPAITKNLLIINGLFFLATFVFGERGIDLTHILGAFYPESVNFKSWQILSHMFMHGGVSHILFNMFALWMFGSSVEITLGPKKFLILYFAAGLGSFFLFNLSNYFQVENLKPIVEAMGVDVQSFIQTLRLDSSSGFNFPLPNNSEEVRELASHYIRPMVGASGAIYGVLVAFGVLYPNAKLALIFLPIPVKAKYFIPAIIGIEFFMGLQNYAWNPVAHFAHIGGAIIGFLLVWNWKKKIQNPTQW